MTVSSESQNETLIAVTRNSIASEVKSNICILSNNLCYTFIRQRILSYPSNPHCGQK